MRTLVAVLLFPLAAASANTPIPAEIRAQIRQEVQELVPSTFSKSARAKIRAAIRQEIREQTTRHSSAWFRTRIRAKILAQISAYAPPAATPASLVAARSVPRLPAAANPSPTPLGAVSRPLTLGVVQVTTPAPSSDSFVAVPLSAAPIYRASVTATAGSNITASGDSTFSPPAGPCFVRLASGQQAGRTMLLTAAAPSGNTTTFTVDATDNSNSLKTIGFSVSNFSVLPGDVVEIFPASTLAGFFASTLADGDVAQIFNNNTSGFDSYTYSGGNWTNASGLPANAVILYPEAAIYLQRGSGAASGANLAVGSFPAVPPLTRLFGGYASIYTSSRYPIDLTLGALNTLNLVNVTTTNNTPYAADTISLFGGAAWTTYYYLSPANPGDPGPWWVIPGSTTTQNNVVLPAGTGFSIFKRSGPISASSGLGAYSFYTGSTVPYSYP